MPRLTATIKGKMETEVEVSAAIHETLHVAVQMYLDAKTRYDAENETMELAKAAVKEALDEAGLKKLRVDGVPVSISAGTYQVLNKEKFVLAGGSLAMLDDATETKNKRAGVRIGAEKESKKEDV
jgi:hypothetical protein